MPMVGSTFNSHILLNRRYKMTNFTLHALDLPTLHSQLHRHTIGFDRMFDELHRSFANSKDSGSYPPYNISKLDETHYVIEVAVAGFKDSELDVELKDQVLTIKGEQQKTETEIEYLHKGISARNFVRTFNLAEHVEVCAATVQNGVLAVALEHIVPEEKQPKKIAILTKK